MELITQFVAHDSYVLDLIFTKDSQTLISAGMDNQVNIWDVPTWERKKQLSHHSKSVNCLALSSDETRLASGSSDNQVVLWSFPDGELLNTFQDRKQVVSNVAFSHNGQAIGQVSYSGRFMVWDLEGHPIIGAKAQPKNLGSIAFHPKGHLLAVSGIGGHIYIYAFPTGELLKTLAGHHIAVGSLQFIENGRYLLSLGFEHSIKLWDATTWRETRSILTPLGTKSVTFNKNETTVVLLREGKFQIWALPRWSERASIPIKPKSLSSAAFSPNGKLLAIGSADKKIRIYRF
ncbi:MAG: hypothetical protein AAF490_02865 [Chloroflexota bacterium]